MSSFHDQLFSEIDAARKLAAEFATRHGRKPEGLPRVPSASDRLAQEQAAAAEITALAAEEERLASQARERAEHRAKARAEELAKAEEARKVTPTPEHVGFQLERDGDSQRTGKTPSQRALSRRGSDPQGP